MEAEAKGPSWARADWPPSDFSDLTGALTGDWGPEADASPRELGEKIKAKAAVGGAPISDADVRNAVLDSVRALMLIRAYRIRGHLAADLDPLGITEKKPHPELDPRTYGFAEADMDRPIFLDNVMGLETASMREIVALASRTYCGTFALQYMHISDPEEAGWLKERIEGYGKEIAFTREGRRAILYEAGRGRGLREVPPRQVHGHQALRPRRRRGADPGDGADHQARRRARPQGYRHRHAPPGASERAFLGDGQALPDHLPRVPGRLGSRPERCRAPAT